MSLRVRHSGACWLLLFYYSGQSCQFRGLSQLLSAVCRLGQFVIHPLQVVLSILLIGLLLPFCQQLANLLNQSSSRVQVVMRASLREFCSVVGVLSQSPGVVHVVNQCSVQHSLAHEEVTYRNR